MSADKGGERGGGVSKFFLGFVTNCDKWGVGQSFFCDKLNCDKEWVGGLPFDL
jgi:hypothetical protein